MTTNKMTVDKFTRHNMIAIDSRQDQYRQNV